MNKFNIDDKIYWVTSSTHYGHDIPCPMCFGKLFVIVILGNGEEIRSSCGYCEHGLNPSSGIAKTWAPYSKIEFGIVSGVFKQDGDWHYSVGHSSIPETEAFANEDAAIPVCDLKLKEMTERAKQYFVENFRTATKKQIWSVGYHRKCIEDAKRNIEWHELRLQLAVKKARE